MRWLRELAQEAGGDEAAERLLKGKGVSLILKKAEIDYKVWLLCLKYLLMLI
jgi:hypothetical protein